MLKVFGFGRVNAVAHGNTRDLRVLWALEETQLPFEIVGLDHPAHALESAAYRALNPLSQIPVIEDDGIVISESGAILMYLARKAGKLIPADPAGEAQVMRWAFAALSSIELPLMTIAFIDWAPNPHGCGHRAQIAAWAERHLGNLDKWLDGRTYIATDSFTVADILLAHVLFVVKDERLLASHANVRAYRDRCQARPAWQRVIAAYRARVEAVPL